MRLNDRVCQICVNSCGLCEYYVVPDLIFMRKHAKFGVHGVWAYGQEIILK